jgi:hypothetical protein
VVTRAHAAAFAVLALSGLCTTTVMTTWNTAAATVSRPDPTGPSQTLPWAAGNVSTKVGHDEALTGVDAASTHDAWAVGSHSSGSSEVHSLVLHWDGSAWTKTPTPNPGRSKNGLSGVAVVAPNDVWAVGGSADFPEGPISTLAIHWDGTSWSAVPTPSPGVADNLFEAVAAVSATDVWAVGDANPDFEGTQAPLVEHWDGAAWQVVSVPTLPGSGLFTDVSASGPDDVWVVGRALVGSVDVAVTEHFDGQTWSLVSTAEPGTASFFEGVTAISPTNAWAVGAQCCKGNAQRTLIEHWDGTAWTVVPSANPGQAKNGLYGVDARSATDIWAVGGASSKATDIALVEHWDGHTWTQSATPPQKEESRLNSVSAQSKTDALAVGYTFSAIRLRNVFERWDGTRWTRERTR